ncbi:PLP-dependent aminotransferase family protein [Undibacterium pigrum]|uniref:GntR family transcriptional regulator n=1 Tax=Undibacterium pigrum TaxID=401470 RepID=A0A318J4E2_9BURK|nr:PLP-dependent aminotransferase family protein [Undibacterium pigrum]PXX41561.1 GntR family transcriptional regulator [Undibacterium pigrum]
MDYALLLNQFLEQHQHLGWSRQRLLHECLRAAIKRGALIAGTRLPPSRELASELLMARNTVLYAYEQLATEGYVDASKRGTVVARVRIGHTDIPATSMAATPLLSQRSRVSAALLDTTGMQAFTPGVPALDAFPLMPWRHLQARAWRSVTVAELNYGEPAGEPVLRTAIANYLRVSRGVLCDAEQIFITDGTQASLDLCAHAFTDAGEQVWMENPGYHGARTAFNAAQLRIRGIPVDADGIVPEAGDWQQYPPRLIYVTPSHQYPLGSVLGLARRMALIEQARACNALIMEDDYDSEFRYDGPPLPAMQGLATDAPVLYLGTFSKTMFPALRLAYIVVPRHLVTALSHFLAHAAPRGRAADQLALAEFISSGQFATHLRRMRRFYKQRRDALVTALEYQLGTQASIHGASTGMHLSLTLPADLADTDISKRAAELGIVAQALSAHAAEHGKLIASSNGLILGYAQIPAADMEEAVRQLTKAIQTI